MYELPQGVADEVVEFLSTSGFSKTAKIFEEELRRKGLASVSQNVRYDESNKIRFKPPEIPPQFIVRQREAERQQKLENDVRIKIEELDRRILSYEAQNKRRELEIVEFGKRCQRLLEVNLNTISAIRESITAGNATRDENLQAQRSCYCRRCCDPDRLKNEGDQRSSCQKCNLDTIFPSMQKPDSVTGHCVYFQENSPCKNEDSISWTRSENVGDQKSRNQKPSSESCQLCCSCLRTISPSQIQGCDAPSSNAYMKSSVLCCSSMGFKPSCSVYEPNSSPTLNRKHESECCKTSQNDNAQRIDGRRSGTNSKGRRDAESSSNSSDEFEPEQRIHSADKSGFTLGRPSNKFRKESDPDCQITRSGNCVDAPSDKKVTRVRAWDESTSTDETHVSFSADSLELKTISKALGAIGSTYFDVVAKSGTRPGRIESIESGAGSRQQEPVNAAEKKKYRVCDSSKPTSQSNASACDKGGSMGPQNLHLSRIDSSEDLKTVTSLSVSERKKLQNLLLKRQQDNKSKSKKSRQLDYATSSSSYSSLTGDDGESEQHFVNSEVEEESGDKCVDFEMESNSKAPSPPIQSLTSRSKEVVTDRKQENVEKISQLSDSEDNPVIKRVGHQSPVSRVMPKKHSKAHKHDESPSRMSKRECEDDFARKSQKIDRDNDEDNAMRSVFKVATNLAKSAKNLGKYVSNTVSGDRSGGKSITPSKSPLTARKRVTEGPSMPKRTVTGSESSKSNTRNVGASAKSFNLRVCPRPHNSDGKNVKQKSGNQKRQQLPNRTGEGICSEKNPEKFEKPFVPSRNAKMTSRISQNPSSNITSPIPGSEHRPKHIPRVPAGTKQHTASAPSELSEDPGVTEVPSSKQDTVDTTVPPAAAAAYVVEKSMYEVEDDDVYYVEEINVDHNIQENVVYYVEEEDDDDVYDVIEEGALNVDENATFLVREILGETDKVLVEASETAKPDSAKIRAKGFSVDEYKVAFGHRPKVARTPNVP